MMSFALAAVIGCWDSGDERMNVFAAACRQLTASGGRMNGVGKLFKYSTSA
jgi:hypothetical protein